MEQIPESLRILLSSKKKTNEFPNFMKKIDLLVSWVGNDPTRIQICGIEKTGNDTYVIVPEVMCILFDIQSKSLRKNLMKYGFEISKTLEWGRKFEFTYNIDRIQIESHINRIKEGNLEEHTMLSMIHPFYPYKKKFPGCSMRDLSEYVIAKNNGIFSLYNLLVHIFGDVVVSIEIFSSFYAHFGPLICVDYKIRMLCSSLFNRGWRFGVGIRTVSLGTHNSLVFNNGNKQIVLKNLFDNPRIDDFWLLTEDGEGIEIESFFERCFPDEIPSQLHYVQALSDL